VNRPQPPQLDGQPLRPAWPIAGAPLLLWLAAVLLLIVAGGFFSTAPGAPALERNDRVRSVRHWDSLGNRFPPPGDEEFYSPGGWRTVKPLTER
jgi:hypothetical protein